MKKLLALTTVIGSTVAIAGCNNTPSVDTLFKDFEKTDVEKYLTIALDQTVAYAAGDGYTNYNNYMEKAAITKTAVTMFLDASYPKFDKKEVGGKIDADISIGDEQPINVHFNGQIRKMNSKNVGYEFDIALTKDQVGSIYLGLERVQDFTDITLFMTMNSGVTIYNKFTSSSFTSITTKEEENQKLASYSYVSLNGTQNKIHQVNVQKPTTGDEVTLNWRAITNGAYGVTTSATEPYFNDKGVTVVEGDAPQALKDALAADSEATMNAKKLADVKMVDVEEYITKLTKDINAQ